MSEADLKEKQSPHVEPHGREKYSVRQMVGLFLGPTLFALMLLLPVARGMSLGGQRMAAVALLMSIWWMTEAIPIPATSLLPLVLYPLLGIVIGEPRLGGVGADRLKQAAAEAAKPYAHHLIFLFLGGFMIALAMQRWNLHRRIAANIVRKLSYSPSVLILGFMIATAFLSMWISNSATTMMMLPIALAVVAHITEQEKKNGSSAGIGPWKSRFAVCMMLGIAYAASIGGVGTLIGTPPNVLLARHIEEQLDRKIDFLEWMKVGLPFVIVFLPIAWLVLTRLIYPVRHMRLPHGKEVIEEELRMLGKMGRGETMTAIVFVMTALGWVFLTPKEIAGVEIPGIQTWFPGVKDSTIAMLGALLLFVLPVRLKKGEFVLNWHWASRLPWGVILLFGGGFALAGGFAATGLDKWISQQVEVFRGAHVLVIIIATATLLIFLTELTSNTATTSMALPVFTGIAIGLGHDPMLLLVPLTIAASCAFMLPVATPPNAIVFGSGLVSIPQMAKAGLILNIIGVVVVTAISYLLVIPLFNIVVS